MHGFLILMKANTERLMKTQRKGNLKAKMDQKVCYSLIKLLIIAY